MALRTSNACSDGITCALVAANNLSFQCRFAGPAVGAKAQVLLVHGFPEWSDMYVPLMRRLGGLGYRAQACNMRGYSPGAAPERASGVGIGVDGGGAKVDRCLDPCLQRLACLLEYSHLLSLQAALSLEHLSASDRESGGARGVGAPSCLLGR